MLCSTLGVSRSGYYKWLKSGVSAREKRRKRLLQCITEIFAWSRRTYGSPRMHQELKREGHKVNHKTVEKIMKENGIQPRRKRRYRSTTDSKHNLPIAPNVVDRQFGVGEQDEVWVSDITYIDTKEGWLYLAVFIDLCSHAVVGWSMSENMTADLVLNAFEMARARRGRTPLVAHSDRGSQYASEAFREHLKQLDCIQSMSRKGNCWDNAVAESFFGALKSELIHHEMFETRNQAQLSTFDYIEIFYNKQRLHSSLGYITPEEFALKGKKAA
jgi:putative transposase